MVVVSTSNSQKLIEWIDRKVEGYNRSEKHYEQLNIIKIYTNFTQQQDTNSIQVPTNYKPGDTVTYPGTLNKVQKFHGLKESSNQVLKELVL